MTETYTIEFVGSDETVEVAENRTVLCTEAGVVHERSRRVGACLACVARLVKGEVEQPGARRLSGAEREEHAVTCTARPRADLVLESASYPTTTSEAYGAEESA